MKPWLKTLKKSESGGKTKSAEQPNNAGLKSVETEAVKPQSPQSTIAQQNPKKTTPKSTTLPHTPGLASYLQVYTPYSSTTNSKNKYFANKFLLKWHQPMRKLEYRVLFSFHMCHKH